MLRLRRDGRFSPRISVSVREEQPFVLDVPAVVLRIRAKSVGNMRPREDFLEHERALPSGVGRSNQAGDQHRSSRYSRLVPTEFVAFCPEPGPIVASIKEKGNSYQDEMESKYEIIVYLSIAQKHIIGVVSLSIENTTS